MAHGCMVCGSAWRMAAWRAEERGAQEGVGRVVVCGAWEGASEGPLPSRAARPTHAGCPMPPHSITHACTQKAWRGAGWGGRAEPQGLWRRLRPTLKHTQARSWLCSATACLCSATTRFCSATACLCSATTLLVAHLACLIAGSATTYLCSCDVTCGPL